MPSNVPVGNTGIADENNPANTLKVNADGSITSEAAGSTVFTTTKTAISSSGNGGDITGLGGYRSLFVMINLSAFTGTSIQFSVLAKDAFGNYYSVAAPAAMTAAGTLYISLGPGLGYNNDFGDIALIQWACTAVTSATFTVTVKAK